MKKRIALALLCVCLQTSSTPVVAPVFAGWLGNNLWQYCIAKILAEELRYKVFCPPIYGFPDTYSCQCNRPLSCYPTDHILAFQDISLAHVICNKSPRNIKLEGYFQKYEYLKPYKEKIRREWLEIDSQLLLPPQDPDDIVVHVRCGENNSKYPGSVPFDYYKKALGRATYKRVVICTDEPDHPFIKNFAPYHPIIHSTRSITAFIKSPLEAELNKVNFDDFVYMLSFNKMILSYSTYAWWIGFLTEAQEIYMPCPDHTSSYYDYGKIDEARYHYIPTCVGS